MRKSFYYILLILFTDLSFCSIPNNPKLKTIFSLVTNSNSQNSLIGLPQINFTFEVYFLNTSSEIQTIQPSIVLNVESCISIPNLPSGLLLSKSCSIKGRPTSPQSLTSYTIIASNSTGNIQKEIRILVSEKNYRVFITNSSFTGNLPISGGGINGVSAADNLCNTDSNKPSSGNYAALIFQNTIRQVLPSEINWIIKANSAYVRVDQTPLFISNINKIVNSNSIFNTISNEEIKEYWTGFRNSPFEWEEGFACNSWNDGTNSHVARVGISNSRDYSTFGFQNLANCNSFKHLLCIEQ
jgi:hypothetical protein